MGCRCNERRTAVVEAAKAAIKGDGQAVADQLKFITTTSAEDIRSAGSVLKQQAQAARARLMQRRR